MSVYKNSYHNAFPYSGMVIFVDKDCEGSVTIIQQDLDNGTSHAGVEYIAISTHYTPEKVFHTYVPFICDLSGRQFINITGIDSSINLIAGDCAVSLTRVEEKDATNTGNYNVNDDEMMYQVKDTVTKVYKKRIDDCVIMMNSLFLLHLPDDITDLYIDQPNQFFYIFNMYCGLWNDEMCKELDIEVNTAVKHIHFAFSIKSHAIDDNECAGKFIFENFNGSAYTGTFIFDEGEFTLEQLETYIYE